MSTAIGTVPSFVDALRGSPLLRAEQFTELERQLSVGMSDPQELAKLLVRNKFLTLYQAKKVLAGRHDDLVIGHYVVADKLGEGGMGKVFRAIQLNLRRTVALKVVRNNLLKNETALKRFQREVKAAAQLSHPNIVRVFDADQVNDRHYLAMEYIEGTDLGKLVKNHGPLPVSVACSYVRQAALGLQHAHDQGFVHRDIKPSNLLVAAAENRQYGPRNIVKILDLGLARPQHDEGNEPISTELTRAGTVVGTPDYMSPEQAKNSSAVDHRSDLYSLGCTFYYLLTGEVVFPNGNPLEKLLQHQMDPPRPVQLVRMDTPAEVATIVHCLLAKKPEQRFQSGSALALALEPWCGPSKTASGLQPGVVLAAEAVDGDSVTMEAPVRPGSPFDFTAINGPDSPLAIPKPPGVPEQPAGEPVATKRPVWVKLAAMAAVIVLFVMVGVVLRSALKRSDSTESSSSTRTETRGKDDSTSRPRVETKPKEDPPIPRDLESIEKYCPNETSVLLVIDVKEMRQSLMARERILPTMVDRLMSLSLALETNLTSLVDRMIVASVNDQEGSLIVLQGKTLVSPTLLQAAKRFPDVQVEHPFEDESELLQFKNKDGTPAIFAFTHESSIVLSANRRLVLEAMEKRSGKNRTELADKTLKAPPHDLKKRNLMPVVSLAIGLRSSAFRFLPAAKSLTQAGMAVAVDERGISLMLSAQETESGKAAEFQKSLADLSWLKAIGDDRMKKVAEVLTGAVMPKKFENIPEGNYRAVYLIPAGRVDAFLAPFLKALPGD